jgi:hypothetical protein
MDIKYNDYIIDFERVNRLTSHPNDNPNSGGAFAAVFIYGLTRKLLKEYLEVYAAYQMQNPNRPSVSDEKYTKVCEILHFNKILVNKSDIRDKKIDNVLSEDGDYSDPNLTW